jgi:hypothetical protein
MKKRKVISSKNLPMRSPLIGALVWWLVLDKLGAPGWVWGVVGTMVVVAWIAFAVEVWNREEVDVFDSDA